MKKLNYLLLGLAGLTMASCSNDDLSAPVSEREGNYHVTVKLPADMATRAVGDHQFGAGYEATVLHYALYDIDGGGQLYVYDKTTSFPTDALETTVDFNLVSGKSYAIVFFAQSEMSENNGAYKFNGREKMFTVDYDAMATTYNQDYYDCFYQVYETGVIGNQGQNETITLYRPVAQVNWGTNDLGDPVVTNDGAYGSQANLLVSKVQTTAYEMFNFFGLNEAEEIVGNVEGTPSNVTFAPLYRPQNEVFPVEGYEYISMQYILVPRDQELINLTMTVSNAGWGGNLNPNENAITSETIEVVNAPVQANFRTNIFGTLLTDKYQYTVVKDPNWFTPDYDIDLDFGMEQP